MTVAAECARLGDANVLDDYHWHGAAKIIALLYGSARNQSALSSRFEVAARSHVPDRETSGAWIYLARESHGPLFHGCGPWSSTSLKTLQRIRNPIYLEHSVRPPRCHAHIPGISPGTTGLPSSSPWPARRRPGQNRISSVAASQGIHETVKGSRPRPQAHLRHEPHNLNLYTPKTAVLTAPTDRALPKSRPLLGQYPLRLRAWAHIKIRSYFKNTLNIAGRDIRIPFELTSGPNWGNLK
jgi:hypothetical protein